MSHQVAWRRSRYPIHVYVPGPYATVRQSPPRPMFVPLMQHWICACGACNCLPVRSIVIELDAPDSQLVVREGRAAAAPLAILPGPPPVLPYSGCTAPPEGCCSVAAVPVGAREPPAAVPEPAAAADGCCSAGVMRRGPPLL